MMKVSRALLAFMALLLLAARADASPPVYQVRVTMQMIGVDPAAAMPLLMRLHGPATAEGALRELDAMVSDGRAELLAWPTLLVASHARGQTLTIAEYRYTAELEPLQGGRGFAPVPAIERNPRWGLPWTGFTPTSFDTRQGGATVEMEAAVAEDGQTIDLHGVSTFVTLAAEKELRGQTAPSGFRGVCRLLDFTSIRTYSQLNLRSGSRCFFGSFSVPAPNPRTVLLTVSATATPIPPP